MYTLDEIYYYLTEGEEPAVERPGLDPTSGAPGEDIPGFTKSLADIFEDIKMIFDQSSTYDEIAPQLYERYYFFSTDSNYWGIQQGTKPWVLHEATCNELSGWTWLNGACWSDAIADSVSWNKGVGDDTSKTGSYTPNPDGDLRSRMEAVVAGRWSEVCIDINGVTLTSAHDGEDGKPLISALAIADSVNGTRDLGPDIGGTTKSSRDAVLESWASADGGSSLPLQFEYQEACDSAGGDFYKNSSTLSTGDNFCWAAACGGQAHLWTWEARALALGWTSCGRTDPNQGTSTTQSYMSFRVVVRPPAE